jgi:hypothetical protein
MKKVTIKSFGHIATLSLTAGPGNAAPHNGLVVKVVASPLGPTRTSRSFIPSQPSGRINIMTRETC